MPTIQPPSAKLPAAGNPQGFFGLVAAGATYFACGYFDSKGFHSFATPVGAVLLGRTTTQVLAAGLAFIVPTFLSSLRQTPLVASVLDFFTGNSSTAQLNSIQADTVAIRAKLGA